MQLFVLLGSAGVEAVCKQVDEIDPYTFLLDFEFIFEILNFDTF